MKKQIAVAARLVTAGACAGVALAATAAEQPASAPAPSAKPAGTVSASPKPLPLLNKPAWLTEMSFSIKTGYDDNLLLVSGKNMPKEPSWFTTVSPKLGFNFTSLLGEQTAIKDLSFGYAPDFVSYHNEPDEPLASEESYNVHRLSNKLKAKVDRLSIDLDNAFQYTDGSKLGATYFGQDSTRSAFATSATRDRRAQFLEKAKLALQYDLDAWFVRGSAALVYQDFLMDHQVSAPGSTYQNYADRYDVNGGPDLGYRVTPKLAVLLGYRYGHQGQEKYSATLDPRQLTAASEYHRILAGVEGQPVKWLTVSLSGGPDFRAYEPTRFDGATLVHSMPVGDRTTVTYYGEASMTAKISPKDTLAFKYRGSRWMASTGRLPYFDSSYELTYGRKLTSKLNLDLAGRAGSGDYTCANSGAGGPTGTGWQRVDWMYTASVGLDYAFTSSLNATAAYSHDWGRNDFDGLAAPQFREFERSIVSLAARLKF